MWLARFPSKLTVGNDGGKWEPIHTLMPCLETEGSDTRSQVMLQQRLCGTVQHTAESMWYSATHSRVYVVQCDTQQSLC